MKNNANRQGTWKKKYPPNRIFAASSVNSCYRHSDAQLGSPGDLDSCHFHQISKIALFVVPSLYQKGRFPYDGNRMTSNIFLGLRTRPPCFFLCRDKN